jgi:hypothetical protein
MNKKANASGGSVDAAAAASSVKFETLVSYFMHAHDAKHYPQYLTNSKNNAYSYHISPNADNSIVNNKTLLAELITQQLSEKDSVLLKALRLIHQQRLRTGNQTGPYSYIPGRSLLFFNSSLLPYFVCFNLNCISPGVIGKPNDYYGMTYMPYAELSMIILIVIMWMMSIMLCWHKYKKLRVLEPIIPQFNSYPPKRMDESINF